MLPFTSLDAATVDGAGAAKDLEELRANHLMLVFVTGSPSDWLVGLQLSHDGTHWFSTASANHGGNQFAVVVNQPARFVRANLTDLTGGTSPTVTATIGSL